MRIDPAEIWRIVAMILAMASPRGEYGQAGGNRQQVGGGHRIKHSGHGSDNAPVRPHWPFPIPPKAISPDADSPKSRKPQGHQHNHRPAAHRPPKPVIPEPDAPTPKDNVHQYRPPPSRSPALTPAKPDPPQPTSPKSDTSKTDPPMSVPSNVKPSLPHSDKSESPKSDSPTKPSEPSTSGTVSSKSADGTSTSKKAVGPVSTYKPLPEQKCPDGASWFVFEDALASVDKARWSLDAANGALISFEDGMKMTLNQSALYVTMTSIDSWVPPVTVEADIKATGVGGVPSAFVMKGPADAGAEIDLEIAAYQPKNQKTPIYQMHLPIWKPEKGRDAVVLDKDGSELSVVTSNGCREDKSNPEMSEWAYTYDGYDPRSWTHYKLEWLPSHIKWHSNGLERASFENKKASSFPTTPLPLRVGPWAVSSKTDAKPGWAGRTDWEANPRPAMSIKNIRIAGCRAKTK